MPDVHRGIISDWGGVLTGPLPETIDAWLAADRIDREHYAAVMAEWFAGIGDTRGPGNAIHALERGEVVISDRSYYSSLAYQGGARGLGIEAVRTVNELALGGVIPDLVVVLWTDPETALARQNVIDRIGGEGAQFQREVAAVYEKVAAENPDRVVLVDASRPVDEVVAQIMELIR